MEKKDTDIDIDVDIHAYMMLVIGCVSVVVWTEFWTGADCLASKDAIMSACYFSNQK